MPNFMKNMWLWEHLLNHRLCKIKETRRKKQDLKTVRFKRQEARYKTLEFEDYKTKGLWTVRLKSKEKRYKTQDFRNLEFAINLVSFLLFLYSFNNNS